MKSSKFRAFIVIGLILAGIFIKAYYISYTETWERQHDVISFGADEGHAAYIEYIFNNKKLPDFDPREKWGFFQPPLHHIISAEVMGIAKGLGSDEHRMQESTQIPTCIYMIALIFMALYIYMRAKGCVKLSSTSNKRNLYSEGAIAMLSIVALHPMFILLSGSINNDALALFLSLLAIIVAAAWYEKVTYFRTILLAVVIGLAMNAKLTGGLVAVPIGYLMLVKFFGFDGTSRGSGFSHRVSHFKKYIPKIVAFALVVFPLGLGFSIRNKIKWGVPINYIPPVGEVFPDGITLRNRLLDLYTDSVYTKMIKRGDAFDEYNVPLALVKTSLFGEYSFADVSRWMKPLSIIVFISAILLIVIGIIAIFSVARGNNCKVPYKWKVLILGTYITYLLAYLYFALSSDNFSAQDFRYSAICIVCQGIMTGLFVDSVKNKKLVNLITVIALIFAASSFLMYALLGFKS